MSKEEMRLWCKKYERIFFFFFKFLIKEKD